MKLYLISILDDDFVSDSDLLVACMILQKQIEHIDGKAENIIIPSVAMNKIREKEKAGMDKTTHMCLYVYFNNLADSPACTTLLTNSSSKTDVCVVCLTNEKLLSCMPCGHLVACVPCGRSLLLCPTCRSGIKVFVYKNI
jgi:hypothetical protein